MGRESQAGGRVEMGQATLVAGTVTVVNVDLREGDKVVVWREAVAGTPGFLYVDDDSISVANGEFDIDSSEAADTSIVNWLLARAS